MSCLICVTTLAVVAATVAVLLGLLNVLALKADEMVTKKGKLVLNRPNTSTAAADDIQPARLNLLEANRDLSKLSRLLVWKTFLVRLQHAEGQRRSNLFVQSICTDKSFELWYFES